MRRFPGKRLELTAHFQICRWTVTLTVAQRAGSPRPFPWCWKASPGPRWCHISRSDRWGRPHSHLGRDLTPQETAEHRALLTTSARSPRSLENATARRPHGTRGRRQAESWSLTALCAHGTGVGWASSSKLCWSVGCARGGHTGSKDGRPIDRTNGSPFWDSVCASAEGTRCELAPHRAVAGRCVPSCLGHCGCSALRTGLRPLAALRSAASARPVLARLSPASSCPRLPAGSPSLSWPEFLVSCRPDVPRQDYLSQSARLLPRRARVGQCERCPLRLQGRVGPTLLWDPLVHLPGGSGHPRGPPAAPCFK